MHDHAHIISLILTVVGASLLTGCSKVEDKLVAEATKVMIKDSIKDECGNEDGLCISAVESQFDQCLAQYQREFDSLIEATATSKKVVYVWANILTAKIATCIEDEDGEPYFGST